MWNWLRGKKDNKEEVKKEVEEDNPDDSELEKKGFNPEDIQVEPVKDECLTDFSQEYVGYLTISKEEIFQLVNKFQYIHKNK